MPSIPINNKCSELRCTNIRTKVNTYCIEHGGKNSISNESTRIKSKQYNSLKWKTLRQRQLSQQPLCQSCKTQGRICLATDVDHVFPWNHIGPHAFMHNVYQSLCRACHSHKTQLEQQGIYRHYANPKDFTDYSKLDWNKVISGEIS
jgi:5-methylcytosine-specific restriction protein A